MCNSFYALDVDHVKMLTNGHKMVCSFQVGDRERLRVGERVGACTGEKTSLGYPYNCIIYWHTCCFVWTNKCSRGFFRSAINIECIERSEQTMLVCQFCTWGADTVKLGSVFDGYLLDNIILHLMWLRVFYKRNINQKPKKWSENVAHSGRMMKTISASQLICCWRYSLCKQTRKKIK